MPAGRYSRYSRPLCLFLQWRLCRHTIPYALDALFVRRGAILIRTKIMHGRDGDCARVHKPARRSCPCATYYPKIIKIPIVNDFPEVAREKGRESFVYAYSVE